MPAFVSPIGIDVEEKQRQLKNNILSFAKRYFSPSEVEFLRGFSETETQQQEFLKLWTLKETKIVVQPCGGIDSLTVDWQFALFKLAASHYAAICVKRKDASEGTEEDPLRLKVRSVVPFVSEECVSGTNQVVTINGCY